MYGSLFFLTRGLLIDAEDFYFLSICSFFRELITTAGFFPNSSVLKTELRVVYELRVSQMW